MDRSRSFVTSTILTLLLTVTITLSFAVSEDIEDEREFDYIEGSKKGPEHWGEIKKEWEVCNNGEMQSPIDLLSKRVKVVSKSMADVRTSYRPTNATLKNRGHDIMLQWDAYKAGSIKIDGTEYYLQQGHWHSPSEHSINGRRYDLELHMVHVSPDPEVKNKIVVVGMLYKAGHRRNAFLSQLIENVGIMKDKEEQEREIGEIDPKCVKMKGDKYSHYMGSLTTPPCTQGVNWFINNKISRVSRGQIRFLRDAVDEYARPVQKLNDRDVHTISIASNIN